MIDNKTAPCKNCSDHTVEPNCHMSCLRYKAYRDELDKAKEERYKNLTMADYTYESKARYRKLSKLPKAKR